MKHIETVILIIFVIFQEFFASTEAISTTEIPVETKHPSFPKYKLKEEEVSNFAYSDSVSYVDTRQEISIPELPSVINQFNDCYLHIITGYSFTQVSAISYPFSISNTK